MDVVTLVTGFSLSFFMAFPFESILINLAPILALLTGMGFEKMMSISRWEDLAPIGKISHESQQLLQIMKQDL